MLSERSQTQKGKYGMIPLMHGAWNSQFHGDWKQSNGCEEMGSGREMEKWCWMGMQFHSGMIGVLEMDGSNKVNVLNVTGLQVQRWVTSLLWFSVFSSTKWGTRPVRKGWNGVSWPFSESPMALLKLGTPSSVHSCTWASNIVGFWYDQGTCYFMSISGAV